ncbi:MAG: hypothetical protein ABGY42_09565 [bacterium]
MNALRDDYAGGFDPTLGLESFSRQTLAELGREYLLHGHLQDRVGLPLVFFAHGDDAMTDLSIEEWMGASPIYSERMQRALGFVGRDVGTVFRNLQLDIGAPHQFMDFQFRLDSPDYGEFWLAHCGALMDVEPAGEERVRTMCHDIEDPTFDATAAATHPRMKMRPIHRPPRVPTGRFPHCRWKIFLDDEGEASEPHANLAILRASKAAALTIPRPAQDGEPGGRVDYSGDFDPGFQFEDLSHSALVLVLREVALQSHLLARAFHLSAEQRWGAEAAAALSTEQWEGISALTAGRLRRVLGIEGEGAEAIAKLFQMHPTFRPRSYCDFRVTLPTPQSVRLELFASPAFEESDELSWFAGLKAAEHPALDAIAHAGNPRARCLPVAPQGAALFAWEVTIDAAAQPAAEPRSLALGRISKGAEFVFERRHLART